MGIGDWGFNTYINIILNIYNNSNNKNLKQTTKLYKNNRIIFIKFNYIYSY